jgi:N-terminal domain of anti-restriction factor ArdC
MAARQNDRTRRRLTDEQRAERHAQDRALARQAVEQLRSSDGWHRWLTTRARFTSYSPMNQLLVALAMSDATRVAGFKAWLNLGYCVRRGEKAVIRIWMPLPPSKKQLDDWRAAGGDPHDKPRTRFKLGPVWDRLSRVRSRDVADAGVGVGPSGSDLAAFVCGPMYLGRGGA